MSEKNLSAIQLDGLQQTLMGSSAVDKGGNVSKKAVAASVYDPHMQQSSSPPQPQPVPVAQQVSSADASGGKKRMHDMQPEEGDAMPVEGPLLKAYEIQQRESRQRELARQRMRKYRMRKKQKMVDTNPEDIKAVKVSEEYMLARAQNQPTLCFISTGGTIDKDYPRRKMNYGFEIGDAAVERIVERARLSFSASFQKLLRKDSQDISDGDRRLIVQSIIKCNAEHIIITHGTDTLIETAAFIANDESDLKSKKVIVLVGAHRPEMFRDTDAHFNVGVAVGACTILPAGVYVAMDGRCTPWNIMTYDSNSTVFKPKAQPSH